MAEDINQNLWLIINHFATLHTVTVQIYNSAD